MAPGDNTVSAADFAARTFDYVIVGGGTAGLVVAARLSENSNVTVGVIEAGIDRSDDVLIRAPLLHTELYEKPEYDWLYKTVPQVSLKTEPGVLSYNFTGRKGASPCLAARESPWWI
jgi:choline dehydrogenase-like flavoprotein